MLEAWPQSSVLRIFTQRRKTKNHAMCLVHMPGTHEINFHRRNGKTQRFSRWPGHKAITSSFPVSAPLLTSRPHAEQALSLSGHPFPDRLSFRGISYGLDRTLSQRTFRPLLFHQILRQHEWRSITTTYISFSYNAIHHDFPVCLLVCLFWDRSFPSRNGFSWLSWTHCVDQGSGLPLPPGCWD